MVLVVVLVWDGAANAADSKVERTRVCLASMLATSISRPNEKKSELYQEYESPMRTPTVFLYEQPVEFSGLSTQPADQPSLAVYTIPRNDDKETIA